MASMIGWKVEQHVAKEIKDYAKSEGADASMITAEMVVAVAQYKAEELANLDSKVEALKAKIATKSGYEKATLVSQLRQLDSTPAEDPTYHNPKWSNYVLTAADWSKVAIDPTMTMSFT